MRANRDFLQNWLVKKRYRRALGYLASDCYPCVNLFRERDQQLKGPEEAKRALLDGLQRTGELLGRVNRLEDAIESIDPEGDYLKFIKHEDEASLTLVSLPDWVGEAYSCEQRLAGAEFPEDYDGPNLYDKYYASGFQVKGIYGDPAVLHLLWSKVGGNWRVVAYDVLRP